MSDGDHSDTLSTISTVSSLTNSDFLDSPPPYSPPRIYAESELKPSGPPDSDDETLSTTLTTGSSSTWPESSRFSPSPTASPNPVPRSYSPTQTRNTRRSEPSISSSSSVASPSAAPRSHSPQPRKNIRRKNTGRSCEDDSTNHSNDGSNRNRRSPRARPPRAHGLGRSHPPRSPMASSSSPPHPLIPSFPPAPPPPPPPPRAPDPPPGMYMGANAWMHPAQGFSIHQSASPSGASQSINFYGPAAVPPPHFTSHNYHPPNVPNNRMAVDMSGMEDMRRGMEDMRRNMQRGMEEMRNSMRQAHSEMNSAFHGGGGPHGHSHSSHISNNAGSMVVIGNQAYGGEGLDGTLVINSGRARGSRGSRVSVNGIQVGPDSGVWRGSRGRGHGSYVVSASSTGGGQAMSQTYVGNDGTRYSYNAYQGP